MLLYYKYYNIFNNFLINAIYLKNIYYFLNKKFYFDNIYNNLFAKPILIFSYNISFKLIDKLILEMFGPFGLKKGLINIFFYINKLYNTQNIYLYFFSMVFLIISILYFCLFIIF
jgi:NADH-ubiquinone oxidoreductase chain 5